MKIIHEINRGGFGVVYEIEDNGQRLAKKEFDPLPQIAADPVDVEKARRRFVREVTVQGQIRHPNIMPVITSDLVADPPWFLMPLANEDCTQQIARDRQAGSISLEPLMDMLAGLEELHRLGYVHRDLKPENILFLEDRWVLSDLGLVLPMIRITTMLTSTDSAWGTVAYAAPEIIHSFRTAPPQSDMFSVGCVLHDIVGNPPRIPYQQVTGPAPIGVIIERCTDPVAGQRFHDIPALRAALVVALSNPPPAPTTPRASELVDFVKDEANPPDDTVWEEIAQTLERDPAADDAQAIIYAIESPQIRQLHAVSPDLYSRMAPHICSWIREGPFEWAYCDVLGTRLSVIYELGGVREQAEAAVSAFILGYSHNRWLVMRKFVSMSGPDISEDLADRLAIEIAAMGRPALVKIRHIESEIGLGRTELHETIQAAFAALDEQYAVTD